MIKARPHHLLIMLLKGQREQVLVEGLWGRMSGGNMDKKACSKGLRYQIMGRLVGGWSLMMIGGNDCWCIHCSCILYLRHQGRLSISHT
jgi:hypothetical protein